MDYTIRITKISAWLLLTAMLVLPVQAQAPYRNPQQQHQVQGINPKILIKAKDALKQMQSKTPPIVIDVRSRYEYDQEHIKGAISYPYENIRMNNKFTFAKNKTLICYCGCPHHLSGLSAEILINHGYKNVKVIDEGFWVWKQLKYPVAVGKSGPARKTSMEIRGQIHTAQGAPVSGRDIFLRHQASGQLEATRTNAQGKFVMHLHFSGVKPQDAVQFSLDQQQIKTLPYQQLASQAQHIRLTQGR